MCACVRMCVLCGKSQARMSNNYIKCRWRNTNTPSQRGEIWQQPVPVVHGTLAFCRRLRALLLVSWRGGDSSDGTASHSKARRNTDAGSSPSCGKRVFSQGQLPMQTLTRCPHSPQEKSHASTSVRALKSPNTGSHTII